MKNNAREPKTVHAYIMAKLFEYGVTISDMAEIVYEEQKKYEPNVTMSYAINRVEKVLQKREVQHAFLVAFFLDESAQNKKMPYPLQLIVEEDRPLFGIDEQLAMAVSGIYGSIATSNFGWLDKSKKGIIGILNDGQKYGTGPVTTFLDDMVAAVIAAAESATAHDLGSE